MKTLGENLNTVGDLKNVLKDVPDSAFLNIGNEEYGYSVDKIHYDGLSVALETQEDGAFEPKTDEKVPEAKNTKFSYKYRDAGNYKTFYSFVFEGEISQEQINRFVDLCNDEMFIPRALGLPGGVMMGEAGYDDALDHYWCEHDFEDSFKLVEDAPDVFNIDGKTGTVKISDFLDAFEICSENWEVSLSKPLNLLDFEVAEQKISLAEKIEQAKTEVKNEINSVNISLSKDEVSLIVKALDVVGDRMADREGYSSGEKYWDLKEKLEKIAVRAKDVER